MKTVQFIIDGRQVEAQEEEKVLQAALRNGIFIPHLCGGSNGEEPFAGCRLCFVEVEGRPRPVTSCTETARSGMVVRTDTERVRRLQRSALRLILSNHHIDCGKCYANRRCRLQELGRALRVKLKISGLRDLSTREPPDTTLGDVVYDRNKCVLCGKCVQWARESGTGVFHFARRGLQTRIAVFPHRGDPASLVRCWEVCPVGALVPADPATPRGRKA
jgi:formate dehydrogenase major subunit/NADH-quinone oxidoreductase subunit G